MRTLLLDADIVAYKVAYLSQEDHDFGDTGKGRVLDHDKCIKDCDQIIADYANTLKADKVLACFTDPDVNFRVQLDPTYKSNRSGTEKPELLMWAKEYMFSEYPNFIRPRLEADDVMGIIATAGDKFVEGEKIIVSEDKDMRTIPAKVYNPRQPDLGVLDISKLDAHRFHLWQTVVGDPTDGYPGCPGVGKGGRFVEYAPDILDAPTALDAWDTVLQAYASKGLTEDDAIHQARMARILQHGDFNYKTKGIRLWTPLCLKW